MSNTVALILLAAGIVLIGIEIVIPGFGLPGIGGIISIMASIIVYADSVNQALFLMAVAAAILIVLFVVSTLFFSKKSSFVLKDEEKPENGYIAPRISSDLVGKTGVAETDLHPSGLARIGGSKLSVISEGEYILKGEKIKVAAIAAGKVKVKREE